MIKRTLIALASLLCIAAAEAQSFDSERFDNGLEQIANSNRNYFKNAGWIEEDWTVLSDWYPEVLLINTPNKMRLRRILMSDEVIARFNALNAQKKQGQQISIRTIEEFNLFIWDKLSQEAQKIQAESADSKKK